MSNFHPQKVYSESNNSLFRIANSQSELISHIQYFGSIGHGCKFVDYYNYNNVFANNYFDEMRQHQNKAISSFNGHDIGQCYLPTSTGKTRVQVGCILKDALEKTKSGKTGTYVVGNHRLGLSQQLIDQLQSTFFKSGLLFDILCINSDNLDNVDFGLDKKNYSVKSSTSSVDVRIAYTNAKHNNRHLLIVATYHSFDRLKYIHQIDMATFDEAHEIVKEEFSEKVFSVKNIQKKFFFTATPKTINEKYGMANEELFGPVRFQTTPREMIDAGEMISPHLHIVSCDKNDADSDNMSIATTLQSYKFHREKIRVDGILGAKLLISTGGTIQMKEIHDSLEFQTYCKENNIKVFAFGSSLEFGYFYNFKKMSRKEVYSNLMNMAETDDAIILHIDILSEGIDVPSITGVALYRKMNPAKLLQTVGRCLRLFPEDRTKLYSNQILPSETSKFIKPFGYVIIPNFFDAKMFELEDFISTLYREYKLTSENVTFEENFNGQSTPLVTNVTEQIDDINIINNYSVQHILKAVQDKMTFDTISSINIEDFIYG